MTYTPKLIQEYRECEQALKEAERLLNENSQYSALSGLERILSAQTDAMAMLRKHREYGKKLPALLEKIKAMKPTVPRWPSEPEYSLQRTLEKYSKESESMVVQEEAKLFEGNWVQCLNGMSVNNRRIVSARELAGLRMKHGKDSEYSTKGSWIGEGLIYMPDGRLIITPREYNPLIVNAGDAFNAHNSNPFREYYFDEYLLTKKVLSASLVLEKNKIPGGVLLKDFGKEPLTAFLGWDSEYAKFLPTNCKDITHIYFFTVGEDYARKHEKPFCRALWANDLNINSALSGDDNDLVSSLGRAFGVRKQSGTGSTGPK